MNTWGPKNSHILRGLASEIDVLCFYLKKGYSLYIHRYKSYFGEIDLVLKKKNSFLLVEVKSWSSSDFISTRLSLYQKKRLQRAYEDFISQTDKEVEFHYAIVSQKEGIVVFDDFWN